ncbi:hypothetical protein [Catenulispora pinisilvae]|uniref:hypothetical protein n=1 Tax=Catenulispora pinisilvae TaxID=2705253 RepID=UPI0018919543|nr:hypothetical protein [Catenulispora pinisilvae]
MRKEVLTQKERAMGWLYEGVPDEEHEGHAVGVLANGVIPAYGSGGRWSELEFRDGWWSAGGGVDDPGVEPAWLVPACVCGWRGERVGYDPRAEAAARGQWDVHMDDVTVYFLAAAKAAEGFVGALQTAREEGEYDARPLAVIKALRVTQTRVGSEIAAAVGAARARELSWELIGEALGVTRQTAHERYREIEAVAARS